MRLAFFSTIGLPWGGSEVLWTATAKLALQLGHEVLVSVFDWTEQHQQIKELEYLGAKMVYRRKYYPRALTRYKKKIFNVFLPQRSKITYHDYLKKFKPHHIHFSLAGGDEIVSDLDLRLFVAQTIIPFSVFYHSYDIGHVIDSQAIDVYRLLFQKSRYSFFTSKTQLQYFRQFSGEFDNMKVLCHPLRHLDVPALQIRESEKVRFAMIGSLICRWKGQDKVIRSLAGEQWKKRHWHLDIYGVGDDVDLLISMAKELGISDSVCFRGYAENASLIYTSSHLIIIASTKDSGPIVLYEALQARRPVIGTPIGAVPDYITTGINGVLAAGFEDGDISVALEYAWEHKQEWYAWGENGRKLMQERYDFNAAETLLSRMCESNQKNFEKVL